MIIINFWKKAHKISADSIWFKEIKYKIKFYWKLDLNIICSRCCNIEHQNFKVCDNQFSLCFICTDSHKKLDHACKIITCHVKSDRHCHHISAKCENCENNHLTTAWSCFKQKKIQKCHNIQKICIQSEMQNNTQKSIFQTTSRVKF